MFKILMRASKKVSNIKLHIFVCKRSLHIEETCTNVETTDQFLRDI